MDYLPEVLAGEEPYCEITKAFSFSRDAVFLLIEARSDEGEQAASALLKVTLSADPTYEVLHEFDSGALDYHAASPDLHYVLASGGYLHELRGGTLTVHPFAAEAFLDNLAPLGDGTIAVFGEGGLMFRFSGGTYTRIPVDTEEDLHALHAPTAGTGYVGGDYGTLLRFDGASLSPVDLGTNVFIRALHLKADGTLLVGGADGEAYVLRDEELLTVEGAEADFYSVTVFKGVEYWGDDDYGIYTRDGLAFAPRFNTGYAFDMTATDDLLTINAGYWVYVFDGSDWLQLQVNADMETLIERVPLDFEPL
ncbi:hypothetical protein [Rhodovulum euryhalinum]|uniref:Uncharacterized protein n=1 Tax=Rhodovulum euryhalinum TaxID=35805 RepID=A0A4R2KAP5_9RHOB|nr:hypothetical protein [Rhodovulum euryhalinum]TCO70541.1 hypothetical protein EV655_10988 [Rhodovulum euryhalinum]